jgi:hypothetical protein
MGRGREGPGIRRRAVRGPTARGPRRVAASAPRRLAPGEVAPDPARLAAGWQPRFAAFGARAEEAIRLYRDLGFEVVADPFVPEQLSPVCGDCRIVTTLRFCMIYTRRPDARAKAEVRPARPEEGGDDA